MKTTRLTIPLLLSLLAVAASSLGLAEPVPRAKLLRIQGLVKVRPAGAAWRQAALPQNKYLWERDEVQTHQHASAVIALDGSKLQMGPLTHIVIPGTPSRASVRSRLQILTGKLLILLIGGRPLEIGTAGATASARGTQFLIETDEAGLTVLTVIEGSVDFYNSLGTVLVGAGEQSTAAPGQAPSRPMRVDPSTFLDWEASPDNLWLGFEKLQRPDLTAQQRQTQLEQAAAAATAADASAATLTAYADLLHDSGRLDEADEAYATAAKLAPTDNTLRLKIAFNLLAEGRNDEAGRVFSQAGQATDLKGLATAGQALATLASTHEGRRARALELASAARQSSPQDAQIAVMAAFVFLRVGQLDPAIAALNDALRLDPKEYRAPAYLALALLAKGQPEAASKSAQTALAAAPGSPLAHEAAATTAFYAGSLADAATEVDLVLQDNPNSATGHLLAAQIAAAAGDLYGALDHAETALALDPQLPMAYQTLGALCLALNDVARAEKAFLKALELQPNMASAMTGLGRALATQDRFADALKAQQAAVALDPTLAAGHNNLGVAYLQAGRLPEAVAEFQQALKLHPDWALVHGNLALAYLEMNLYAQAVAEGELAIKLGGESARVHTTLARVYLRQNRVNKAWATLRRALQLDPDYPLARMHLAEVYRALGQNADANDERLQAMSRQPSAMIDSRSYARTEVEGAIGSLRLHGFTSGRGNRGQDSFYVAGLWEEDDGDRLRTDFDTASIFAAAGRQTSPERALLAVGSFDRQRYQLPGPALPGGLPTDVDDTSRYEARDLQLLMRAPAGRNAALTARLGGFQEEYVQHNPDSLIGDPNPLAEFRAKYAGPQLELRLDARPGYGNSLIAGLAAERRTVQFSGLVTMPGPTYSPFLTETTRETLSGYVDWEDRLNERTWLLLGGRMACADGANPVFRPRLRLRYQPSPTSNIVLLARPVLADDTSRLSLIEQWGTHAWMSPGQLLRGGYLQSYELQYEVQPTDGSILRVAGFYREMRSLIVPLQDPQWATMTPLVAIDRAHALGVEVEYERWLTSSLSAGIWARYTDSENEDAGGLEIPYQPKWLAQARLDYLDRHGWRCGLVWSHVGERFADVPNTLTLGSYNRLDLNLARRCNLQTDVFLNVENLLDEDYRFYLDYPGRGRRVIGGVRYRF